MKRNSQTEGIEAVAKCKKTNREYMKRCHEAEGIEAVAKCKITNREYMKRYHEAENRHSCITQVKLTKKILRDITWLNDTAATQKATTIHQKRENGKGGSIMLAQFAMTRK
jgi:hypothetical protein